MKNTTLYRKYRPQKFQDVLGQPHISEAISRQIENASFSHAYLFAGSKGTGKTSIARIFAREIGTHDEDIYEIDAASTRRIDEIRELRQSMQVLPFVSPYKVYIIDEAHMLTTESFNALLKSLEEPPEHVIFMFATTELHKIPETIQSRCETYHFRKPNQKILADLVMDVTKKEGFEIERPAADLIAVLGEGAFRDTLGMLQKILHASKADEKITVSHVSLLTGAPSTELVGKFLKAVTDGSLEESLKVLGVVKEENLDRRVFLRLVLEKIRIVLLLRFAPEMQQSFKEEFTEEEYERLRELATKKTTHINSHLLSKLLEAIEQTGNAHIPELPIELALIETFGHNSAEAASEASRSSR